MMISHEIIIADIICYDFEIVQGCNHQCNPYQVSQHNGGIGQCGWGVWCALQLHVMLSSKGFPQSQFQNIVTFDLTEFRQTLQVQSHLEMPRILVQLGHTQRT